MEIKKLEDYKAFNAIAWALVVGFSMFTLNLALGLNAGTGLLAAVGI